MNCNTGAGEDADKVYTTQIKKIKDWEYHNKEARI